MRYRQCRVAMPLNADLHLVGCVGASGCGRYGIVFLDNPITISGDPDISLIIDEAAMCALRHIGGVASVGAGLDEAWIAPPGDRVSVGIKNDDRRRRDRGVSGVLAIDSP